MATATAAPQNIVAPNVRDLDVLARDLTAWLAGKMPAARDIRITNLTYPDGSGRSHETILFDIDWREDGQDQSRGLVVRIKPTSMHVYQDDMFDEQYEIMRVMEEGGEVRIATPLWIEQDPSLLGAPFFIMEKRHGRVPVTQPSYATVGWLFDAKPADRAVLWEDGVRQLAAIQKTPLSKVQFLSTGAPGSGFDQELDRWRRYLTWVQAKQPMHFHEKVFAHLSANQPKNRPEGIVWGDARLGNMMFGDDFRVAAVMDWEQCSLGGALHDLAWWVLSEEMRTTGVGAPTLEGMGSREQTVALWEEATGIDASELDWYIHFAAFKMACLGAKMTLDRDTSERGPDLYDTSTNRYLADAFGWERPKRPD